jgi:hypothetical protein
MRFALLLGLTALLLILPTQAADFKPEDGFKLLLTDKNLDGWKTKTGDPLSGQTEAYKGRFKLADGVLTADIKVKGDVYIYTAQDFSGDVHVKFDYLPGKGCNNDLFIRGLKFDIKTPDVKNMKEGEWNQFEIVITGKKAEFKNNGELQKTLEVKNEKSNLGIRAELGPIQIRHVRIKAAK